MTSLFKADITGIVIKTITNSGALYKIDDTIVEGVYMLFQVQEMSTGQITEIVIDNPGENYNIGDVINFTNDGTFGSGERFVKIVNGAFSKEDNTTDMSNDRIL